MPYKDEEQKREYDKKYRETHRESRNSYSRKYYSAHKDKWQLDADGLVAKQNYCSLWRVNNPTYHSDYKTLHREANRRYWNTYHARKLNAFVEEVDREIVFLNDNGICQWQYCEESSPFVDPANWHLDHIKPLSKGGEHSYENVQVTHPRCNTRKGSKESGE